MDSCRETTATPASRPTAAVPCLPPMRAATPCRRPDRARAARPNPAAGGVGASCRDLRGAAEEVLPQHRDIVDRRCLELLEACFGQIREHAPAVLVAAVPLDVARGLEPVDQAGRTAAREEQVVGQIPLRSRFPDGVRQLPEHLELRQRHARFELKLPVERAVDREVQGEEEPPDAALLTCQQPFVNEALPRFRLWHWHLVRKTPGVHTVAGPPVSCNSPPTRSIPDS